MEMKTGPESAVSKKSKIMPFYYWIAVYIFSMMFGIGISEHNSKTWKDFWINNRVDIIAYHVIFLILFFIVEFYVK